MLVIIPHPKLMEYYEAKGIKRGYFKTIYERQGWNFLIFVEIGSGESDMCSKR